MATAVDRLARPAYRPWVRDGAWAGGSKALAVVPGSVGLTQEGAGEAWQDIRVQQVAQQRQAAQR